VSLLLRGCQTSNQRGTNRAPGSYDLPENGRPGRRTVRTTRDPKKGSGVVV